MSDFIYNTLAKSKKQKYLFIFSFILLFGLVFYFNYTYPNVEDDWTYAFVWKAEGPTGLTISHFSDLYESQYAHYMLWGGRTIAHTIAQILLNLPPILQDILNTLAYITLMLLIYRYSNFKKPTNSPIFLLICLLYWFFQPIIISTSFWITGSANYMWCMLIILFFIYPYYSLYMKDSEKNSLLKSILLFAVGIIAGWTNENTVLAVIFLILGILVLSKIKNKKIPIWAYVGFLGLIIGALLLFLAPGNLLRYNSLTDSSTKLSFLETYLPRLNTIFIYYYKYIIIPSSISIFFIIYYTKKGNTYQKDKIVPIIVLLFTSAHIALFAMLATPIFPERAMFGLIVFLIMAIGISFSNFEQLNTSNQKTKTVITIISFALIVSFIVDYSYKYRKIKKIYTTIKERETIIEQGKKAGIKDFIFDNYLSISHRYHYWDLLEDPNAGKNKAYSYYYNIKSATVIDRSKDTINQYLIRLKEKQDSIITHYGN